MQKYQQVIRWIINRIEEGTYPGGAQLPTESELCSEFGLSRQTIRRALQELVNSRILYKVQGSGTFVQAQLIKETQRHIAVVCTYAEEYIFPPIMKGIEQVISKEGYSVQISFTDNEVIREREALKRILADDSIAGLIAEPSKSALPNPNLRLYDRIKEKGIPVVYFNAVYPGIHDPCVSMNDCLVAEEATTLLLQKGHKKIGGIFKADDIQGHLRYQGYINALLKAETEVGENRIIWLDTQDVRQIKETEDYIIKRLEGCTALFCYNDTVAFHVIQFLQNAGKRVPEDVSVIGIDNAALSDMARIPITTFDHPKENLGKKTAEILLSKMNGDEVTGQLFMNAPLVWRSSVTSVLL